MDFNYDRTDKWSILEYSKRLLGKTLEQAEKELKMVAEGVKTCMSAYQLGKKLNIDLPIINQVYEVLFNNKDAKKAVYDLMTRSPKAE